MGEIDTKPIESVQTAINFFGQPNNEQRKNSPTNDKEGERETDIERVERELANIKVQLEVKEAAYKQALVKLDHYHKTTDELSTLLKNSDLKKSFYINESQKAGSRVTELESSLETLSHQLSQHEEVQKHLQSTQEELETLLNEANEAISRLENERSQAERAHAEALTAKEVEIERANEQRMSAERAASELSRSEEGETTRLKMHVERVETELERAREQENEAQVEMALLKFELHKGRSRLAAAEAAETRAQGEKTALYNALQQMGLEAEETKNENRMLREELLKLKSADHEQEQEEEEEEDIIKLGEELEEKKRELEVAMCKMGELRTRAEQAISRAEAAEKARGALEEEKRKRREQRGRRKAALEALRQESITREFEIKKIIKDDQDQDQDQDQDHAAAAKIYQPLAKVLNMKF